MGFDLSDIRPTMDVFTADNALLGTVLRVHPGPVPAPGDAVPPDARQSSAINGEMLGPMPTEPIGNPGPINQSAASLYGVAAPGLRPIGRGWLEVSRWWGLRGSWHIPMSDVQTVSLERVVLRRHRDEI